MNKLLLLASLITLVSCSQDKVNTSTDQSIKRDTISTEEVLVIDATASENITDTLNYAVYYVTVADTGNDYFVLHKLMNQLAPAMNMPIDTLGKGYDLKKQKITLPENSDDEIYAGEYYPRRYTSNALSLEYLNFYNTTSAEKTIALVTNICSQKDSALYYAKKIPKNGNHIFVMKSNVYIGCMH